MEDGCTLPPPYNIIPSPKFIYGLFCRCLRSGSPEGDNYRCSLWVNGFGLGPGSCSVKKPLFKKRTVLCRVYFMLVECFRASWTSVCLIDRDAATLKKKRTRNTRKDTL